MTGSTIQERYSDLLTRISRPARLIGNEFGAGAGFSGARDELRVVLAFPDVYEIGIANQALQILYYLARRTEGVGVERTYLPWVDALAEMRTAGLPLLTLESWSPVSSADLLGITLQHEFNYTNVLELVDLAGVPVRAADRAEGHPLVVAGGPAVANFLPVSPFFDAVAVGDGEEMFPEILTAMTAAKRRGASRAERRRVLSQIEGVFVPGESEKVKRRVLRSLQEASYPSLSIVPLTQGVHDRAWVEVMRGCSRGCRFCQAGMWYRPVRERPPEQIVKMAVAQVQATGHEELALASLSTTDYTALGEVLPAVAARLPETKISLPSLRVDSAAVRLAHLVSPTGPALTLAPEAGSQRMRNVINKNVSEEDVLAAAAEAFRCGYTSLKLYFLIGLPFETDEDVEAIARLCLRLRDLGRQSLGQRAGRLQLSVSVNNFVPKPFTPFQWTGMAAREVLRGRQELLWQRLRKRGIKLALHDVEKSYLEAALARGGVEMADVIQEAWKRGARFDSWTEQFCGLAWQEALEAAGTTPEALATRSLMPGEEALPWQIIEAGISSDYLAGEWRRAAVAEKTPDCRTGLCGDCGACEGEVQIQLARPWQEALPGGGGSGSGEPAPSFQSRELCGAVQKALGVSQAGSATQASACVDRYLLTFAVEDKARFIGHLDKLEVLRRAVRRAGGRLALSAGLRPKPLLSLALPLAVGIEGRAELCEFALRAGPPELAEGLAAALPTGLRLVSLEPYVDSRPVAARVVAAEYELELDDVTGTVADVGRWVEEAARRFGAAPQLLWTEQRRDRVRTFDLKMYVENLRVLFASPEGATVGFRVAVTPTGSVRPERVAEALAGLHIRRSVRTRIVLA